MIDELPTWDAIDELPPAPADLPDIGDLPRRTAVPDEARAEAIARSLPVTQWAVDVLTPHEWMRLADYLTGLLARRPLLDGAGYWQSFRIVIGALASELRQNALDAGEPAEVVEDLAPAWIAWEKRMDHEYALAIDPMLHRPLMSDRSTVAPVDATA